jgi:uncharacterized protein
VVPRPLYCDSSALVKLVAVEPESQALQEALGAWPTRVSSVLTAIEVPRVARRGGASAAIARAEDIVSRLDLIDLDLDIRRAAAGLDPPELRSLDAIHLATALSLGDDLGAFLAYDARLVRAARASGLTVLSPD